MNLNTLYSELRSCVKVEVAVQGSSSLRCLMVSVDVKKGRGSAQSSEAV